MSNVRLTTPPRIAAAFAALVTAMGLAVGLVLYDKRPTPALASLIPASNTVAFFSGMTKEELQSYLPLFPILASLPGFNAGTDIALLELPDTNLGWVMMQPDANGRPGRAPTASSSAAEALLAATDGRLADWPTFRTLMAAAGQDSPTAFLDLRSAPLVPRTAFDRWWMAMLGQRRYAVIERQGKGWRVHLEGGSAGSSVLSQPLPLALPALTPAPSLALSVGRPQETLQALSAPLASGDRDILRSIVLARIEELLGPEVSPAFDLLPLLERPALVAIGDTASGGSLFLWRGSTDDPAHWARVSARLLESAGRGLVAHRIERRAFDRGFAVTSIREEGAASEETREQGGWQVRGRGEPGATGGFFVAIRGREFLIASDRRWLDQAIAGAASQPASSRAGVVAQGRADLAAFREALASTPLPLGGSALPFLGTADGTVAWSLERAGPILSLTLAW